MAGKRKASPRKRRSPKKKRTSYSGFKFAKITDDPDEVDNEPEEEAIPAELDLPRRIVVKEQRPALSEEVKIRATGKLKSVFGHQKFMNIEQKVAVMLALERKYDLLVVTPTGSGKSLIYQLPSVVMKGTAIVFSPLISLIADQIKYLQSKGIRAEALNSTVSSDKFTDILSDLKKNKPDIKMLYVTPETALRTDVSIAMRTLIDNQRLSYWVIDEAHCLYKWGSNFRPNYKKIREIRARAPEVPVIALTATATARMQHVIKQYLNSPSYEMILVANSTYRPNLHFSVHMKNCLPGSVEDDIAEFINRVLTSKDGKSTGTAIVFTLTRNDVDELAVQLKRRGIKALPYHGTKSKKNKDAVLEKFLKGELPVVVSTSGFGMGIDKADVRVVIHHRFSTSIDDYLQQAGRAGRDKQRSYCRVYFGPQDLNLLRFMIKGEAEKKVAVENCTEYCKSFECRHAYLARAFGEDIPPCGISCDVCTNPEGVRKMIQTSENKPTTSGNFGKSTLQHMRNISPSKKTEFSTDEEKHRPAVGAEKKVMAIDFKTRTVHYVKADECVKKAPPKLNAASDSTMRTNMREYLKKKLLDNPKYQSNEGGAEAVATQMEQHAYDKGMAEGIYRNTINGYTLAITRATKESREFDYALILK